MRGNTGPGGSDSSGTRQQFGTQFIRATAWMPSDGTSSAICVDAATRMLAELGVDARAVRNDSWLAAASEEVRQTIRDRLNGG